MAIASSRPTLGEGKGVGWDGRNQVQAKFRLRRVDNDTVEKIDKELLREFGSLEKNRNTGVKELVVKDPKARDAYNKERGIRLGCAIWTGAKDVFVELVTEADVRLYDRELGLSSRAVGQDVRIDGRDGEDHPPEAIKRNVLLADVGLANSVVNYGFESGIDDVFDDADDRNKDYPEEEEEEDLKKTSLEPSHSEPVIPKSASA